MNFAAKILLNLKKKMNKEISPAALWRSHQKNLNPTKEGGAFEEIFRRQQQNNSHNQNQEESQKIPLTNIEVT